MANDFVSRTLRGAVYLGVVIVPTDAIDEVIARVEEKNSGENLFRKAVKDGMAPSEAFAKYGVL